MTSLEEANRFVNCVMNRTKYDTMMRGMLVVLLAALPMIAIVFGALLLANKGELDGDNLIFLVYVSFVFLFYSEMLVIFFIYRRLLDHSSRDSEWRDSLTAYARECGCDVQNMLEISKTISRKEKSKAEKPAIFLIILLFLLIMIFIGFPEVFNINTDGATNVITVLVISVFLGYLMFFFVILHIIKVPYVHESLQRRFTEEFAAEMDKVGVSVPILPFSVKNVNIVVLIILVILTLGLFILYLLYKTFVNTNYHIMNQWDYEEKLMNTIIENEGGSGVMPIKAVEVR